MAPIRGVFTASIRQQEQAMECASLMWVVHSIAATESPLPEKQ
jgi:hypothetical protein